MILADRHFLRNLLLLHVRACVYACVACVLQTTSPNGCVYLCFIAAENYNYIDFYEKNK